MAAPQDMPSPLPDDTNILKVSDGKYKYIHKTFGKVSAKMYDYNCDIKLKVGKETFKAHRDVLTEASVYFSAMFGHNMREKEQDVIELHEISPQGFTAMMDYFYHGHVTVDSGNVADILEAARFFHIDWLIRICCDFLIHDLSLENYQSVVELADKYVLGDLRTSIFRFVSQNWEGLASNPKFRMISPELLEELLADDHYIHATEGFIFNTVLQWLEHDLEDRKQYKESFLSLIKYPLLEEEELAAIPEDILEYPAIQELVSEAKTFHAKPSRQCLLTSAHTEVRGANDTVVLMSAVEDAYRIQYKVPGSTGFLSEEIDTGFLQSVFEFSSVAVLGNFLFVAGGYDRDSWCSSPAFYRYNPRNRSWAQLSPMKRSRVSFPMVASSNGLYAIAGIEHIIVEGVDREKYLTDVDFYEPESNTWNSVTPLAIGCFSIGAAVVNEKIYISGGITDDPQDNVPVNYLQVYDPNEKSWSSKARMLVERQMHGMIGHDNKLYVFGGYTAGLDTMSFLDCLQNEVYDIETDQWSALRDLPSAYGHVHGSLARMGDELYVLGGKYVGRCLHTYNIERDELSEGEAAGDHVQKVAILKVAFPPDLLSSRVNVIDDDTDLPEQPSDVTDEQPTDDTEQLSLASTNDWLCLANSTITDSTPAFER